MLVDDMVAAHVNATIDDEPVTRRFLVELAEERLMEDTAAKEAQALEQVRWEAEAKEARTRALAGETTPDRVVSMGGES